MHFLVGEMFLITILWKFKKIFSSNSRDILFTLFSGTFSLELHFMTSLLKAVGFGKQDFVGDKARWELDEMLLFDLPCFVAWNASEKPNQVYCKTCKTLYIVEKPKSITLCIRSRYSRAFKSNGSEKKRENMRLVSLCNRSQFSDSLRNSRWLRLTMKSGISPACTHQVTSNNIDPLSMSKSVDVGRTSWVIYQAIK